ncbi:MAG: tyrosine-type recombinase/integrase [Candidatus Izemoplasmatales bacterium]
MKFSECIVKFRLLKQAKVSSETMRYYNGKLPIIERYLGNHDVADIDEYTIAQFVIDQQKRNPSISNRTLNYYTKIITRIVKDITGREIKIQKRTERKQRIPRVSEDNILKILKYYQNNIDFANNKKYYLIIRLFLETGVRLNELVNIKIKNINLPLRSIYLDVTKSQRDRMVYFSKETRILLLSYIDTYIEDQIYLFPSKNGNSHLQKQSLYKTVYRLQNRLGIEQSISPHKWRHTFAKKYKRRGGDLPSLQAILGHTELNTTKMYLDYEDDELKEIYDQIMGFN